MSVDGGGGAANRGRHVDTIGKQLADIRGKGAATLKRVAEASEGRIVMRQTDSGGRLSSFGGAHVGGIGSGLAAARLQAQAGRRFSSPGGDSRAASASADCELIGQPPTGAEDSISVTTTTSDVNSDDDAASIASRLSQIVVEEEGKLLISSAYRSSQMLIIDNSNRGPDDGRYHGPAPISSGAVYRPGSADCTLPMGNQLKPTGSSRARSVRSNSLAGLQQLRTTGNKSDDGLHNLPRNSARQPVEATQWIGDEPGSFGQDVPKIHVIKDTDLDKRGRSNELEQDGDKCCQSRQRAHSAEAAKLEEEKRQLKLSHGRDHGSSEFLPERGDLRRPEVIQAEKRKDAPDSCNTKARNRYNTLANVDKTGLSVSKDQLMLNIRRSAWTLSEFEQTFNKSSDRLQSDVDCRPLNRYHFRKPLYGAHNTMGPQTSKPKQSAPDNLLVKIIQSQQNPSADSNAANGCIQTMPDHLSRVSPTGRLSVDFGFPSNSDRRPSYDHSIISMASTVDSGHYDTRHSFLIRSRLSRKKRKQKRKNNDRLEDDCIGIGDQQSPGEARSRASQSSCCQRSCFSLTNLAQYVPILGWLPAYKLSFLWGDLMAGLAVAVLNISTSLSAAVVAETDFSVAFRASIINTFVYALLCSSRHTSFGSWSIMSQMLFISVRRALSNELILARINLGPSVDWAPEEYERWHLNIIVMYTFLIGLVQLVCGLLNLGKILASFIPEALCSSMITATAFTMAIGQLSNMCGTSNQLLWSIEKNSTELWVDLKNPPISITDLFAGLFRWMQQILLLVKYYEQINLISVLISVISVFLLILNQYVIQKQLERFFKRKIFIPSELILLVLMIIVSSLLNLKETYKVTTCGPLNIDFVVPDWPNFRLIRELWFDSFATALISFTMVYVMAKTYSNKFNYEVDCNQELIACGAGNLIGGLCDALPATASFSRTAGQVEAGGQTQLASIINCVGLFVMARILGHHVAELPVCVMAATLFYGFARMMTRFSEVFIYWRVCKVDFAIWIVTFAAILTLDIVNGFIYGFIFSIFTMLYRAQNRRCYMLGSIGSSDVYVPLVKYPLAREIDGIKIFQFCGPIHYVCADLFEHLLRQKTRVDVKQIHRDIANRQLDKFNPQDSNLPTHIILDFSMISYVDSAGVHVIKKIIEDFQRVNITILLASLASHVATVVKREPSLWSTYKRRFYVTLADAVHCAAHDSRLRLRVDQSIKIMEGHQ